MAIASISNSVQAANTTGTTKNTLNKDDFLKILIEQIKHQDPLEPMKPDQFLSQLSQLTQVEELQNIAKSLESMRSLAEKGNLTQWLSAIGKKIGVDGSTLSQGDEAVLVPAGDYDSVILTLKSKKDGNMTEVSFAKGDSLTYINQGTDDVIASAFAVKNNQMVSCKVNTYRTVRGIVTSESGYQMVTGNGDTYPVAVIKQIKN